MYGRPIVFVVISLLVVALIYSSVSSFIVLAVPKDPRFDTSTDCTEPHPGYSMCCWDEDTGIDSVVERYCQQCNPGGCWPKQKVQRTIVSGDVPFNPVPLEEADPTPTTPTPPPRTLPGGDIPTLEPVEPPLPPQLGEAIPELTPPTADEGTEAAPRTVEPLTRTCEVGNEWDPKAMICVPDVPPLELCPDGSIPQPMSGPGGTQPECPSSGAEQLQAEVPGQTPAEEPEQPEAQEELQEQSPDGGDEQQSDEEQQPSEEEGDSSPSEDSNGNSDN